MPSITDTLASFEIVTQLTSLPILSDYYRDEYLHVNTTSQYATVQEVASMQRRIYPWARAQGPPKILRFRGVRAKFRKTSELQVPLQTYLATMSIKIHANRVLGTMHVTQIFLGVFQGAQIKSGPKAPTDLNAALHLWNCLMRTYPFPHEY